MSVVLACVIFRRVLSAAIPTLGRHAITVILTGFDGNGCAQMAFFQDIERLTTYNCTELIDHPPQSSRRRKLASGRKAIR